MKRDTGRNRQITGRWRPATCAVRGGTWRSEQGETSEAIFLTSGYTYENAAQAAARFAGEQPGMTYSRTQNPSVQMLEERIALMEGAEACRAQASGMAAMSAALLCQLSQGDHLVAARAMFGPCRWVIDNLLPRFGIAATFVDGRDNAAWESAVRPNTRVFFFETPANPTLDVVDIAFVSGLARAHRIVVTDFEDWGVPGPTAQDLSRTLARNGLPVEARTVPNTHGRAGEAILSAATSLGCDLLVKGAYTQSRLRQLILGGATSYILSNTTLPVLMAH